MDGFMVSGVASTHTDTMKNTIRWHPWTKKASQIHSFGGDHRTPNPEPRREILDPQTEGLDPNPEGSEVENESVLEGPVGL